VVLLMRFILCLVLIVAFFGSSPGSLGLRMVMLILIFFTQYYPIVEDAIPLSLLWRTDILWRVFKQFEMPFFSHFSNHFKARHIERPGVRNFTFKTLSFVDGGGLVKSFTVDDIKVAVWDCDSFKSL
jgi:hypothetical protein